MTLQIHGFQIIWHYRLAGIHFYALPRVNRRADRVFRREIDNILQYYDDNEVRKRYRFGRQTIVYITNLARDEITPTTNRTHAVSSTHQVLITLRFLASGSFQQVTGDTLASLDKATTCRIIRRVTVALCRKINQFIKFPQSQVDCPFQCLCTHLNLPILHTINFWCDLRPSWSFIGAYKAPSKCRKCYYRAPKSKNFPGGMPPCPARISSPSLTPLQIRN